MSYVIYVCDTETTGINPEINDVIEVSFWRITLNNSIDEQKTWCIKPTNPSTIEEKALHINKHKREDILHNTALGRETYGEPADVVEEIEAWIMDDDMPISARVFVGQNPEFDYKFLKQLWTKTNNKNTFPFYPFLIDTIQVARLIDVCIGKRRDRYNLGALVKDFGVTKVTAHRADGDTKMTKDLFLAQIKPLIEIIKENFG